MSSLVPDKSIVFSPALAATIGLEEAILLQVLNDAICIEAGDYKRGYQWFSPSCTKLLNLLPFWTAEELQRVSQRLKDKGLIIINSAPLGQSDHLCFALNEKVDARPTVAAIRSPSSTPRVSATTLPANWSPDEDLLQLMMLNHNIPRTFALEQLEDFLLYWRDRQEVHHSWSSKFRQNVLSAWRRQQSEQAKAEKQEQLDSDIRNNWHPSEDALEILYRAGITKDFIEDAVPEFVLYWRERGEAHSTWNSKFIAHIRRQWAQYTKALELDYEPREIAANWQPNEDVYDILRLANIDLSFARQLVPEFVLFWRDTQQIQRSWNTKFLQHVKYQWATRHDMTGYMAGNTIDNNSSNTPSNTPSNNRGLHGGQSNANRPANKTNELRNSPFKQLTDRSWAEGIVEDI